MPRIPDDPTIYAGLRLFDGFNYDTVIERVEHGGFGVIAFGPNRLDDGAMTVYKTLRRKLLDDPATRANFVRECLLWVGLWGHFNVVLAHRVVEMTDQEGSRPFLVLDYAEYGSLRTLLEAGRNEPEGRLPLDIGLGFAQQIAAGLAYLHEPDPAYLRNDPIVHRDLKPENVLVMENGRAVITDLGLAKAVEQSPAALALLLSYYSAGHSPERAEEAILVGSEVVKTVAQHTAAGMALGTAPYMAPEQWEDARFAGTPADLYAFGVMLSELLAGRHALLDLNGSYSLADWRRAHQQPQPRSLREVASAVPDVVEALYRQCLARDPEDRPSARQALAILQAGARLAGLEAYDPPELILHTPYNEIAHWHMWSIAYRSFDLNDEALARNDRAVPLARQLKEERTDLLAAALLERGNILNRLGKQARADGRDVEADNWDQQAEAAYQESLEWQPQVTLRGRSGRASVWNQIGLFNFERQRYAYADDAFRRALALQPDMADSYVNRSICKIRWGQAELDAGRREAAIVHLRQARVYAITSLGMNYPAARMVLQAVEQVLAQLGVTE